ncbi:iron chelate uptake ABC transporter family permease subunit [Amycolatopsis sp. A1MSW2902]|uniref:iron chelate uptake ABC transporter family permease subunit n=1 Tax=Amycolatopsis sp. A1MSW2902 TaxID=687413 RepID=UPI00307CF62E
MSAGTILDALTAFDGSDEHLIVRTLRIPRTLAGIVVGAALGTAGAVRPGLVRRTDAVVGHSDTDQHGGLLMWFAGEPGEFGGPRVVRERGLPATACQRAVRESVVHEGFQRPDARRHRDVERCLLIQACRRRAALSAVYQPEIRQCIPFGLPGGLRPRSPSAIGRGGHRPPSTGPARGTRRPRLDSEPPTAAPL